MIGMLSRQQIVASALVGTGFTRVIRRICRSNARILTFHGLVAEDTNPEVLDRSLHTSQGLFRKLCAHLSRHYQVLPLDKITRLLSSGEPLPDRTVAITFDDGYESNYQLAFPILREFNLPAAIFLCTGFIDGSSLPWFIHLENAMSGATVGKIDICIGSKNISADLNKRSERAAALGEIQSAFKKLPYSLVQENLDRVINALQPSKFHLPVHLRAMSWSQTRELRDSNLITLGAHTHTHPILGRCAAETARHEIITSRDRIAAELGIIPQLFAYPNGLSYDYTPETKDLLQKAGFKAAFTMIPGLTHAGVDPYELPRYGSPETLIQAEATVSGASETFKSWRGKISRAIANLF